MGGGYCEVRRGGVGVGGESSGRVFVEQYQVAVSQCVEDQVPTSFCPAIFRLGIPGRAVGVEVSKDDAVVRG